MVVCCYIVLSAINGYGNFLFFFSEYDYQTFYVQPQPIHFLTEPNDHFTVPGVDVTFVCSVTISNDFSHINWFYNNSIIEAAGPRYIINNEGQSISTLTVKNVSIEDRGDYHCCVSDWKTKIRSRPGKLHGKQLA